MEINKRDLLFKARQLWSKESQIDMAIEECSELIQALQHYRRGRCEWHLNVAEELADVSLTIDQLIMYDPIAYSYYVAKKLRRLKRLIDRSMIDLANKA
jgi:hypothetical protein